MSILKKDREFIVEENDVMDVLKAIDAHLNYFDGQVGNCGWGDGLETKWYVAFKANDKKYGDIIKSLKEIGRFTVDVRPGGQMDVCFERAES